MRLTFKLIRCLLNFCVLIVAFATQITQNIVFKCKYRQCSFYFINAFVSISTLSYFLRPISIARRTVSEIPIKDGNDTTKFVFAG